MKRWPPLVVLLALGAGSLVAETVQEVYARAVRTYIAGNPDAARKLFQQVLTADPENKSAAAYLHRIDVTKPVNSGLRRQMDLLIVPKVDFHDASLSTVLDYLPKVAAQQSGGKTTLNIVRLFPAEFGREKLVTLQLDGAPMSTVLEYIAQLTGVTVDYQTHAIVIGKASPVAPTAPAAQ